MTFIFANDLPYSQATENPFESLKDTLAFSVDDWGDSRAMSWVWGIVLGWDDESLVELASRHRGWTPESVERLKRLHAAFQLATAPTKESERTPGYCCDRCRREERE